MIAKGTPHANGARLAKYMTTGKDGERAELFELRGFADDDIVDAFRSVHVMSEATQCRQPFFHCQVRNPKGENLTRAQWQHVANRLEAKLGLTDQPRAIAFHIKDGHEHMHVAWSRIDTERMIAKPLPFYKLRLKETCRALEVELGLSKVRNEREAGEPRAPARPERDQATRLGIDIEAVRRSIRDAWTHSDNGRAFMAALAAEGMTLARGDKRDYVVLDQEGGIHALGKRLLGASAAEVRARLDPLGREMLPSIAEAREQLAQNAPQQQRSDIEQGDEESRRGGGRTSTTSENAGMVAQNAEANRRHLEVNPFLKPQRDKNDIAAARATLQNNMKQPAADKINLADDKKRSIEEKARDIEQSRRQVKDNDTGRDR